MEAAKIERWISVIEDNDFLTDKDKQIQNLINLWKFSSCYDSNMQITDDGQLHCNDQQPIGVAFTDICLEDSTKINFINNIFSSITPVLDDKHMGAYYIELHRQNNNFTSGRLSQLEEEIVNAIHGRLTIYNHVKKITKVAASAGIYTNMVVKNCSRADISNAIKTAPGSKKSNNKWLVLVLDRLISHCDSFYISDDVLFQPFRTSYDKLFLFDFYKGEVVQLAVTK